MSDLTIHDEKSVALSATTTAMVAREQQEIQGAIILARKFPRDQGAALKRIEQAFADPRLAEIAEYSYPTGGQTVEGPTIRLLEAVKQSWGNIRCGIKVTHQDHTASHATAYAWDLETNDYQDNSFIVPHWRDTKKGGHAITDAREIRQLIGNMGSRSLRSCLERVIPRHIIMAARDAANGTMQTIGNIEQRRAKMLVAFAVHKVTQEQIEKRLGKKIIGISNPELLGLGKIANSLRDGMTVVSDWFESSEPERRQLQEDAAKPDPQAQMESAKKMFSNVCADAKLKGAEPLALLRSAIPNPKLTQADIDKATSAVLMAYAEILFNWVKENQL